MKDRDLREKIEELKDIYIKELQRLFPEAGDSDPAAEKKYREKVKSHLQELEKEEKKIIGQLKKYERAVEGVLNLFYSTYPGRPELSPSDEKAGDKISEVLYAHMLKINEVIGTAERRNIPKAAEELFGLFDKPGR